MQINKTSKGNSPCTDDFHFRLLLKHRFQIKFSVNILIPNSLAFSKQMAPCSPLTIKSVLADTEETTLPPLDSMIFLTSSLVFSKNFRETTMLIPFN